MISSLCSRTAEIISVTADFCCSLAADLISTAYHLLLISFLQRWQRSEMKTKAQKILNKNILFNKKQ
jgi:hypothetical protein